MTITSNRATYDRQCTPLRGRRNRHDAFSLLRVVIGAVSIAACGASGAETPSVKPSTAAVAVHDTATLTADAVAIAGFTIDTARTVPWRTSATVPARLMLDPTAVQTIGSITEGRVTRVLVRVGDVVRAGDVLVMIHSHEIMDARSALVRASSQLIAADAERALARTAAERAQRLVDAKAMSRAELERAQAARQTADAMFDQATAEKERAKGLVDHLLGDGPLPNNTDPHDVLIRTAVTGVVTSRDVQPGTVVLPGTPLITVGDPTRLLLQMQLSESAARAVGVGSKVRFSLTDDPTQQRDAVVARIAPTVDTITRTIEVLATPSGGVKVGRAESFAQAEVFGAEGTPAVVVPAAAIQSIEGDTVVIAIEQRGSGVFIEAVPVRVGRRSARQMELLSGLGVGRPVVVGSAAIAKAELLKRRSGDAPE